MLSPHSRFLQPCLISRWTWILQIPPEDPQTYCHLCDPQYRTVLPPLQKKEASPPVLWLCLLWALPLNYIYLQLAVHPFLFLSTGSFCSASKKTHIAPGQRGCLHLLLSTQDELSLPMPSLSRSFSFYYPLNFLNLFHRIYALKGTQWLANFHSQQQYGQITDHFPHCALLYFPHFLQWAYRVWKKIKCVCFFFKLVIWYLQSSVCGWCQANTSE